MRKEVRNVGCIRGLFAPSFQSSPLRVLSPLSLCPVSCPCSVSVFRPCPRLKNMSLSTMLVFRTLFACLWPQEQAGEYVLVSNLGSIVARLLFQPLEEMALATFGQLQALAADGAVDAGEKKRSRQTMLQASCCE